MLAYMEWSLRGVRGIITDKTTGQPLNAAVEVICIDHKVYTDPDVGDYHRILVPGTYNLQFSAQGYYSEIISDISVSQGNAARLDVSLIPQIHGDINADRKITLSDLISALQIAAGGEIFPVSQAADVNGDKRIGIEDAVYILNEIRKSYEL
jgi:carboxypeptidase D